MNNGIKLASPMIVKTYITHAQLNFRKVFIIRQSSRFILLFLFYFSGFELPLRGLGSFAYAQPTHPPLDEATLAEKSEYTDMEEALKANPLEVYKLYLSNQNLTKVPSYITRFKNLQILDCSSNQLTSLPNSIGELKNLQILNCSSNQLTSLPHTIGALKNLQILNISSNPLTTVPVEIGNLSQLKELDVSEAEITQPIDEGLFPFLEKLDFGGNITIALQAGKTLQERTANVRKAQSIAENKIRREREIAKIEAMKALKYAKLAQEADLKARSGRERAEKFRQEAEDRTKVALFEKQRADKNALVAENEKENALKSENQAQKDKKKAIDEEVKAKTNEQKAIKAEKEAHEAKQQAQTQRNIAFGVGIVAVLLGIFALYQMSIARKQKKIADIEKAKSEKLLLNILPEDVATELKEKGITEVKHFENASILFADVKGFSALAAKVTPKELIAELDATFSKMDEISMANGLERIKTIGDCYMAVAGVPHPSPTNPVDITLAALAIQKWMNDERQARGGNFWQVRLGTHTGELVAGVIGKTKFAYDVWGSSVNLASRMESGGEVGRVNTTEYTKNLIQDFFEFTFRGELEAKNIGKVNAYFVDRIKPELSADEAGFVPNERFYALKKERFGA